MPEDKEPTDNNTDLGGKLFPTRKQMSPGTNVYTTNRKIQTRQP